MKTFINGSAIENVYINSLKVHRLYKDGVKFYENIAEIDDGSTGNGTEANPYKIRTEQDLRTYLRNIPEGQTWYKLMNDIDINEYGFSTWMEYYSSTVNNTLHFDGNNKKIKNIVRHSGSYNARAGLFYQIQGNTSIKNLTIENMDVMVNNGTEAGFLVNRIINANGILIENCHIVNAKMKIESNSLSDGHGGLIGTIINKNGNGRITIKNSSFNGEIIGGTGNGGSERCGGLIGEIRGNNTDEQIIISECQSWGKLKAGYYQGGFLGYVSSNYTDINATFEKCFTMCTVGDSANDLYLSTALAVHPADSKIYVKDCYSRGRLNAAAFQPTWGGFVSTLDNANYNGNENLYFAGTLRATSQIGAFAPKTNANNNIYGINIYYDSDLINKTDTYYGSAPLTTEQLKTNLPNGFSSNIWGIDPNINEGYPYLKNNLPRY